MYAGRRAGKPVLRRQKGKHAPGRALSQNGLQLQDSQAAVVCWSNAGLKQFGTHNSAA